MAQRGTIIEAAAVRCVDAHGKDARRQWTRKPRMEPTLRPMAVHDIGSELGETAADLCDAESPSYVAAMDWQAQETKRERWRELS